MNESEPLHPHGPELGQRNRRILAERLGWPDGAVEACESVDDEHPGWHTTWAAGNDQRARTGYYATRRGDRGSWVYGATTDELAAAIGGYPTPRW